MFKTSIIVQTITRKLFPLIIMFGIYIATHGQLSPGGGFQGGIIVGAGVILYVIAFNLREADRILSHDRLKIIESGGVLIYALAGMWGIFLGYSYLANKVAGFPFLGKPGTLFSGGTILIVGLGVALHVIGTVTTLFYAFIEEEDKEE